MKRITTILMATIIAITITANHSNAEDKNNTPPEGFKALFNGKDLTGWKGFVGLPLVLKKMSKEKLAAAQKAANTRMPQHWKVTDGVLVFDGKGKSLCTAKDYANFEMFVDWKIKKLGDSGIYIRGYPQIQIWDPFTAGKKGPAKGRRAKGSGALYNNRKGAKDPLVKADKPIGQWNTFRIRMVGSKLSVWLNGKLVTDNVVMEKWKDYANPIPKTGTIELQNHGNTLYFRNIYIKELP